MSIKSNDFIFWAPRALFLAASTWMLIALANKGLHPNTNFGPGSVGPTEFWLYPFVSGLVAALIFRGRRDFLLGIAPAAFQYLFVCQFSRRFGDALASALTQSVFLVGVIAAGVGRALGVAVVHVVGLAINHRRVRKPSV